MDAGHDIVRLALCKMTCFCGGRGCLLYAMEQSCAVTAVQKDSGLLSWNRIAGVLYWSTVLVMVGLVVSRSAGAALWMLWVDDEGQRKRKLAGSGRVRSRHSAPGQSEASLRAALHNLGLLWLVTHTKPQRDTA